KLASNAQPACYLRLHESRCSPADDACRPDRAHHPDARRAQRAERGDAEPGQHLRQLVRRPSRHRRSRGARPGVPDANGARPSVRLVRTAALQMPLTGALTLGWFGLPALGIRGPAAASVISFTLAALWMASRLVGPHAQLRLHWPYKNQGVGGFRWASFRDIL